MDKQTRDDKGELAVVCCFRKVARVLNADMARVLTPES
jgi:hypothetical protein